MGLFLALYDLFIGHPVTVMGVIGFFVGLIILASVFGK
jgi:hypothetical protein